MQWFLANCWQSDVRKFLLHISSAAFMLVVVHYVLEKAMSADSRFGKFLVCCFVLALTLSSPMLAQDAKTAPTATVTGGQVRGIALTGQPGALFRGIPFAQPPVGDLRWREPQPVKSWTGVRAADKPGTPCAQRAIGWNDAFAKASTEDCLYLDVWTPDMSAKARKPVMLWIHGGGNMEGAGGFDPLYQGSHLIQHGVVLVIPQYRLGIFGFLAHKELSAESPNHVSGNYAILDLIAALRWVHDNIAQFGGDPDNVTIFGQSAGAFDVSLLMSSPLAKGLFHHAIAESGFAAVLGTADLKYAEERGAEASKLFGAPEKNALKYLRALPPDALIKIRVIVNQPNVDGYVFPVAPDEALASGKAAHVPVLLGNNIIEDMSPGGDLQKKVASMYRALGPKAATALYLEEKSAAAVADARFGNASEQFATDTAFRCPGVVSAMWVRASGAPVWRYEFGRAIPPKPTTQHSTELPYVFGNLWNEGSQAGQYTELDRKISDLVETYWTNFAKTGNPNGLGLPEWPKFDGKKHEYLEFMNNGEVNAMKDSRVAFCNLFGEELKKRAQTE